jgi:hypothetical protein
VGIAEDRGASTVVEALRAHSENQKGWDRMNRRALRAFAICALAFGAVSVTAQAAVAEANVIYNPNFSHGLRGWRAAVVAHGTDAGFPHISVVHTAPEPMLKCDKAQRAHPYLEIDVPGGADGYVEQNIIVPVNPGRLTFRTWGGLEPVKVSVSIVDGPLVHQLRSFNPPTLQASPTGCSNAKPITESFNVSRYSGEAVGLRIQATSEDLTGAGVDFDSFALGLS